MEGIEGFDDSDNEVRILWGVDVDSHWMSGHTSFKLEPVAFSGPQPGPSLYPAASWGVVATLP